ncbi:hypothetical protein BZG35_09700 [Brevundimonas sp. LM2]|uniref:hypothetical protein n=1 Tax=Brevundimonas sp. LM2 TaxID=1938605 RepID=UPI000983F6AD|nr:hypothetical protein [Brevundimonas sp. LM2]AQR61892.1 hypothetical protein BZG35_09700 [Brevundimonas sp. LM2]
MALSQGAQRRSGNRGVAAVLKVLAAVPALGFVFAGLAWWITPALAGSRLGMDLLGGLGLSTQIADLASFFLTLGTAILIGLLSDERVWLYPPIMLIGFAIIGRLVAWRFHGADFAGVMIAVEACVLAILILNVRAQAKPTALAVSA